MKQNFAKFRFAKKVLRRNFAEQEKYFAKFRETLLYLAKFRRFISFANEISRNFVKYSIREMIWLKVRKILLHEISRNYFKNFAISRNKNVAKFREISFRETSYATKFREIRKNKLAKFR